MKFLITASLCLLLGSCSSGSGSVVGNGLTAGHPMNTMMEDSGDCGCGHCADGAKTDGGTCSEKKAAAPGAEADCGCGHKEHHHKKKAK